jgi:anti-anti-sigma factor
VSGAGPKQSSLIFNLSGVSYLDSSAIGSLVNAHVACTNRGHKMALAAVPDRVRQMLAVTRVGALFAFSPDVRAAEDALGAAAVTA